MTQLEGAPVRAEIAVAAGDQDAPAILRDTLRRAEAAGHVPPSTACGAWAECLGLPCKGGRLSGPCGDHVASCSDAGPVLDPLKDAPARAAITSACASLRQRRTTVGPLPLSRLRPPSDWARETALAYPPERPDNLGHRGRSAWCSGAGARSR